VEYRDFGQTDLKVSAIGFGCWEMGGTNYGDISPSQVGAAIHRAIDLGINCFDTAPGYGLGESERFLGRTLGARRKDVIVVTKCGVGVEGRFKNRDGRRANILASCEESLKRLGTDYVDVLLIHWPDVTTPFEETMRALDDLVKQGKTRFVGESNFTLGMIKECEKTRRMDVVQGGFNMFDRRLARDVLPYCEEQKIGVMTYGSLAFGLLAGAFTEDTEFGPNDWRGSGRLTGWNIGLFVRDNFRRNVRLVNDLKPIAAQLGKRMPHLALRWVLSNPAVSTALVGMRNVQEVEDNMGALDWALSEEVKEEIDSLYALHGINPAPDMWFEKIWEEESLPGQPAPAGR